MRASTRWLMALGGALAICVPALGQEAAPKEDATSAAETAAPRRKAKLKPARKQAPEAAPKLRTGEPTEQPSRMPDQSPDEPVRGMAATRPTPRASTTLSIVCDPGQAVLYEKGSGTSVWVTRAGSITIDNPLRPLTPDTTRVLQLVIGDKVATAYGGDLLALKRGASPAVLEGALGGAIHWDATLPTLPDSLNIVADSGATLAELPFQSCGQAPATRAVPVAKTRNGKADAAEAKTTAKTTAKSRRSTDPKPPTISESAPQAGSPPRSVTMPRGAIGQ